ncbi:MAG: hypothetical protein ABJF04_17430 [Reichenbachiella sp.]|uniref:hypothetical protein n=1 Tax=Reichenbachiella sp. TaxID=2184521 RepID=UPI00326511F5
MQKLFLHRKKIACFFILTIVAQIGIPTFVQASSGSGVSASTAGPTAPEATSFEPVDASDMVNLLTGDLAYTIPLLNVPGPAGNYPMALSYHAGIKVRQEPSWVGLGWNISPGAINRKVNGIADDMNGDPDVHENYWEGGETTSRSFGITIGFAVGPGSVGITAGIQIADDTYKGRSVGGYIGPTASISAGSFSIGGSAVVGISPYGGAYASAGLSAGYGVAIGESGLFAAGNLGISTSTNNGTSAGAGVGIGIAKGNPNDQSRLKSNNLSLLGADISTDHVGVQASAGGGRTSSTSAQANHVSTSSSSSSFSIPVYYGISISFGKSSTRYWIDEKNDVNLYGSLFQKNNHPTISYEKDFEADVYELFALSDDLDDDSHGMFSEDDSPVKQLGGTFPDYDNYSVATQGLGGAFQPYMVQHALLRPMKHGERIVTNWVSTEDRNKVGFRFIGDFSNSMIRKQVPSFLDPMTKFPPSPDCPCLYPLEDGLIISEWTGKNKATTEFYDYRAEGYNEETNQVAGSKHIEYYTNAEIMDLGNQVVSGDAINRSPLPDNQVGGFEITNSNGITYHFMLPVYSKGEQIHSVNLEIEGDNKYDVYKAPYAYTWLLTAITGPDYVERGGDGLDEKDFGYWVAFDYNKWRSESWRSPEEGYNEDIEPGIKFYTQGTSERYYLDKVTTASHTALFAKSSRIFDPKDKAQLDAIYLMDNLTLENVNDAFYTDKKMFSPRYRLKNVDPELLKALEKNALKTYEFTYGAFDGNDRRLRLDQLLSKGLGGADIIPPTIFKYKELNDDIPKGSRRAYNSEAYDSWQMYKSDYEDEYDNPNIGRLTSIESAEDVDMWSLDKIISTTGQVIKIGYESDVYSKVDLHQNFYKLKDINTIPEDNNAVNAIIESSGNTQVLEYLKKGAIAEFNILGKVNLTTNLLLGNSLTYKESYVLFKFQGYEEGGVIKAIPVSAARTLNDEALKIYSQDLISLMEFKEGKTEENFGSGIANIPTFITEALADYDNYELESGSPLFSSPPPNLNSIKHLKIEFALGMFKLDLTPIPKNGSDQMVSMDKFGGGVRVHQVVNQNPVTGFEKVTEYDYTHPYRVDFNDENLSSGTLLHEEGAMYPFTSKELVDLDDDVRTRFLNTITKSYAKVLKNARLLPAPEVLYEYVTKKAYVRSAGRAKKYLPNYATYNFQMYDERMLNHEIGAVDTEEWDTRNPPVFGYASVRQYEVQKNEVTVSSMLSQMGVLKSITSYEMPTSSISTGAVDPINHTPISKSIYNYLHEDESLAGFEGKSYIDQYKGLVVSDYEGQGIVNETFGSSRSVMHQEFVGSDSRGIFQRGENYYKSLYLNNIGMLDEYPVIQTGETHINYRTGSVKQMKNNAFDFYSGDVIATETKDGNGRTILIESDPAYWYYGGMGLKINGGKNMLTQPAAQMSYLVNPGEDQVLEASITTWDDEFDALHLDKSDGINGLVTKIDPLHGQQPSTHGIWRKKATYTYLGDLQQETTAFGTPLSQFLADMTTLVGNDNNWYDEEMLVDETSPWQKNGEITLYDVNSHALEAKNEVSGTYVSTKMTADQIRVLSVTNNSQYEESAYSGGEEMHKYETTDINGVALGDGKIVDDVLFSHSGNCFVQTFDGDETFLYSFTVPEQPGGLGESRYKAMVWCYVPQAAEVNYEQIKLIAEVAGGTHEATLNTTIKTYGSWQPIELVFDAEVGEIVTVKCVNQTGSAWAVKFDDFRLQPFASQMVAYVYDQTTGRLTYTLDNNNFYTQYKYDPMGRLSDIVKEINGPVPRYESSYRYWNKFSQNKK